jgi:hypothetical protein
MRMIYQSAFNVSTGNFIGCHDGGWRVAAELGSLKGFHDAKSQNRFRERRRYGVLVRCDRSDCDHNGRNLVEVGTQLSRHPG